MTKITTKYDEECPIYEDDTWAIPFNLFSQESSLFSDYPDVTVPEFVEEVFACKEKLDSGCFQWVNIVGVNVSKSASDLFKKYFSENNPRRVYRLEFEFYLSFHNWIDSTTPFSEILPRLKEQYEAVSLISDWFNKGKIKITNTDNSPSVLYFLVTPDIFNEVLTNPGISYLLNDNQVATLAQNHYNEETEISYSEYNQI